MTDREKMARILGAGLASIGTIATAGMVYCVVQGREIPTALSNTAIAAVAGMAGAAYIPARQVVVNGKSEQKHPPDRPHELPPGG